MSYQCEQDGRCSCKTNVGGDKCTKCLDGYFYNFPNCSQGIHKYIRCNFFFQFFLFFTAARPLESPISDTYFNFALLCL